MSFRHEPRTNIRILGTLTNWWDVKVQHSVSATGGLDGSLNSMDCNQNARAISSQEQKAQRNLISHASPCSLFHSMEGTIGTVSPYILHSSCAAAAWVQRNMQECGVSQLSLEAFGWFQPHSYQSLHVSDMLHNIPKL